MFKPEELVGQDPEKLIKMTKKGQTMMMFATVSGIQQNEKQKK